MEEVFGPITPVGLIALVTGLTQFCKKFLKDDINPRYVQLIALGWSVVFFVPFHLLQVAVLDWWSVYASVVFTLIAWTSAIGAYEVTLKK